MINSPIVGMYAKRSAIAGQKPACTRPITGMSVPRYQNQPTPKKGAFLNFISTPMVRQSRIKAEPTICKVGNVRG